MRFYFTTERMGKLSRASKIGVRLRESCVFATIMLHRLQEVLSRLRRKSCRGRSPLDRPVSMNLPARPRQSGPWRRANKRPSGPASRNSGTNKF